MSLSISLPLIINRSVNVNLDRQETNVGDISVLLRRFVSPTIFSKPTNIQLSLGSTIPTGNGITNVITNEKNFVSGTFDPIVNLIAAIMVEPGWSIDSRFYTRQGLTHDARGTKIGAIYSYGLNVTYAPIGRSYQVNTKVIFVNRGKDEFNQLPFPNSGGDYINISPGLSKIILGASETALRLWTEIDIPLYQKVHGTQLVDDWNFRIGLNYGLTIFGHKDQNDQKPHSHLKPLFEED